MRTKLIRNLRPGDEIKVIVDTDDDFQVHRVRVTGVQEIGRGAITRERRWSAEFEPALYFGSWHSIVGYADSKTEVY